MDDNNVYCLADDMLPPPEPTEFLYEIRVVAENIGTLRCSQSEVHPPECQQPEVVAHVPDVEVTNASNSNNVCTLGTPQAAESAETLVERNSVQNMLKSPSTDPGVNDAHAWVIPMTQERSLHDLPSQMELDWQDSVTTTPTPSLAATRNLGEALEAVGSERVVEPEVVLPVDAFAEVSQIAQEAVTDAGCSRPERVDDPLHAL